MPKDISSAVYEGAGGEAYLAQRRGATSNHVQSMRASLFSDLPTAEKAVLDFGCGTGGLLKRLDAKERFGVEIGEAAAEIARENGVQVFSDLAQVDDNAIDVSISFHAIEHVPAPLSILKQIARVTKGGAPIRLIVPGENVRDPRQSRWFPNDDKHLYTWTPLLFGNLAEAAGLKDIDTRIEAMPTGSRLVRALRPIAPLSRLAHARVANRLNSWNVILNAAAPD